MKITALCISSIIVAASAKKATRGENRRAETASVERKLMGKGEEEPAPPASICAPCEFETFYHYVNQGTTSYFWDGIFTTPAKCTLAAIRDEESRRAAQYAVPEGKVALTQGYFPIADYLADCHFMDEKTVDGQVSGCHMNYESYFVNYEGTLVVDDPSCWDVPAYSFDDGVLYVAIGSDGILKAVKQTLSGTEGDFAYDGAVYECCPAAEDICNEVLPPPVVEE